MESRNPYSGGGGQTGDRSSSSGTTGMDRSSSDVNTTKQQVADQAQQMTDQAQQKAGQMADMMRDQVLSRLDDQKDRASQKLDTMSQAMSDMSDKLRQNQDTAPLADAVDQAAQQLSNVRDYLHDRNMNEIVYDVEDFARRQPGLFLGGAFLLGFLAARFLKSSSQAMPSSMGNRYTGMNRTYPYQASTYRPYYERFTPTESHVYTSRPTGGYQSSYEGPTTDEQPTNSPASNAGNGSDRGGT